MRVLLTGASGFIGSNLYVCLTERLTYDIFKLNHADDETIWKEHLTTCDVLVHLAGVNRCKTDNKFSIANEHFPKRLISLLRLRSRPPQIVFTSSVHSGDNTPYGQSKLAAEQHFINYAKQTGACLNIFRLTNVFGKWCRPNYNSVVATFCHNVLHDLPLVISSPKQELKLIYIDDVTNAIQAAIDSPCKKLFLQVQPEYSLTLNELATTIESFNYGDPISVPVLSNRLHQALYATYLSHKLPVHCVNTLEAHADVRGMFAEFIHTTNAGQCAFFTTEPGVTRGEHYHHTKSERFLIVSGTARFDLTHVLTGEQRTFNVDAHGPTVVETVPGWAHSITNIGENCMVTILWSSEIFDPEKPDTIPFFKP